MSVERDMRDAAVDAAWRAHLGDEPSEALDDAILAAAHRAVDATPGDATPVDAPRRAARPRWQSWAPLAAAATLAVVAFGIVQLAPHDEDRAALSIAPGTNAPPAANAAREAPPPASSPPESAPARSTADSGAAAVVPASPPSAKREAQSRLGAQPPAERRALRTPEAFPRQTLPQSTVQSEAAARSDAGARMQRDKVTAEGVARPEDRPLAQPSVASPSAQSAAAERAVAAPASAEAFVQRIALLHAQGADDEAANVLRKFRAAYPDADAQLPQALQQWARTVTARLPEATPR
jgi:hypothetical protein